MEMYTYTHGDILLSSLRKIFLINFHQRKLTSHLKLIIIQMMRVPLQTFFRLEILFFVLYIFFFFLMLYNFFYKFELFVWIVSKEINFKINHLVFFFLLFLWSRKSNRIRYLIYKYLNIHFGC